MSLGTILLIVLILMLSLAILLILLAMTAVAALLLLIRLIFNPLDAPDGVDVGRGIGMILSVVSGIVAAVGGYLNFTSKGGNIKELLVTLTQTDAFLFRQAGGAP